MSDIYLNDPVLTHAAAHRRHLMALQQCYEQAMQQHALDAIVLHSGKPKRHFADDQDATFKSHAHFLHWVPMAGLSDSWLVIRPGERPLLYLYAPDDFWHLSPTLPTPEAAPWSEAFEIIHLRKPALPTRPAGRIALLGEIALLQPDVSEALKADANPAGLLRQLDEGRVCKSEFEIACLEEASLRAAQGHLAARRRFMDGGAELDIQLAYLGASRQRESDVPYGNIVGLNEHAAVLHYQHYALQAPATRHSLLVDAGASVHGYASDITRSWAGDDALPIYRALIEGVDALQKRLITRLAPGLDYVALHLEMHRELGELLRTLGVVSLPAEAQVEQGITAAFCPHGLGHLLGLQVHDVAGRIPDFINGDVRNPPVGHPMLRLTRELQEGMAITIEPGCYIIPMLLEPLRNDARGQAIDWSLVEALAPHGGVRIEDNLVITADGAHNLTRVPATGL
ncbi:Xaa-Pro dipeptidase [Cobetia sp. L2A1]|uniref:Xaa-Pro dipeptidase n=1 Tax=Cobetia sp. L2A1 TaxID=2686360 RepID=UPI00131E0E79|nr:Xaa-Pro dipeptidase [Cobetia sp. L2A1]